MNDNAKRQCIIKIILKTVLTDQIMLNYFASVVGLTNVYRIDYSRESSSICYCVRNRDRHERQETHSSQNVHTSKCSVGSDDSNFQSCLNCVIYSLLCVNFVLRHICIRITNSQCLYAQYFLGSKRVLIFAFLEIKIINPAETDQF